MALTDGIGPRPRPGRAVGVASSRAPAEAAGMRPDRRYPAGPMTRILVCGYYGFGNTGDEAILTVLLSDLGAAHPDAEVTVLAGSPEAVAAEHGVGAVHWQDIGAIVDAAAAADLMVLGGGGLFQDHQGMDPTAILTPHHGSVSYYGGFALLAGITRTPLVLYGLGVGPLSSADARRYTRLAFGRASAATVRDEASRDLLAEIGVDGVTVTADPVWGLEAAPPGIVPGILALEDAPEAPVTVGVAVRPWGDGEWMEPLAAALDRLVETSGARVLLVPFHDSPHRHENDAAAAVEVVGRMGRADRATIVRGGYTPAERAAILGSCDVVVGMRLHAVVLAAIAGAPVVALSYDPKVRAAMAALGRTDLVLPLVDLTAEAIATAAETARRDGPAPAGTVDRLRKAATANRAVLAGPFTVPAFDADTSDALADLAFARARTQASDETEIARLRRDLRMVEIATEETVRERDDLADQLATIVESRAFGAVQGYWHGRERLRRAARNTAVRAPAPLRPVLEVLAGAEPEPPVAAAPTGEGDPVLRRQIRQRLDEILAEHSDAPGIVVYPPSIGWKVSLFQRPQQMALAFARLGYLVLYGLDPVNNEGVVGFEQAGDRLYLMSLPWGMNDLLGLIPSPTVVSYVYNYEWTRYLREPRTVFEHIDELEVFTAAHEIGALRRWYEDAVAGAELVAASAGDLLEKVRRDRPDAILCPNGVDYRHFSRPPGEPPADVADLVDAGRPVIGYYGAIAEWVDFGLIRTAAEKMSDVSFVFIGPEYDASVRQHLDVFDLPNVRWLGVKDYDDLPDYLAAFDVATIPFVVNDVTQAVSPIKLFEYMAGGRPVVTPNLRECARYEAVLIAADADDYVAKLRQALALRHDPEHQALLRRTARANTWEMRAGTLVDALAHRR